MAENGQRNNDRVCGGGGGMLASEGDEGKKENLEECVITCQASAAASSRECFYCGEKQTASFSNYEYLAPVTLRVCSTRYRLFLKDWSQTKVVIIMCF